jgi:hypothetical protein
VKVCASAAVRLLVFALIVPLAGCTLYDKYSPAKRAARKQVAQLQSLQLTVMSFADEYVARTGDAITRFQAETDNPEDRLLTQDWRVQQATSAYTIASGPSPVTNALDMVVLASLSRMRLEDHWVVERFGARTKPLQETYRRVEAEAWQIVNGVLTEAQSQRLKEIMAQWRATHPEVQGVSYVHFQDFADSVGAPGAGEGAQAGSLFSMLGIDPFSSLDPAVREITQSRALAERTIYYLQRAPTLLDMQVVRLTYQFAVMPESKALLADAQRVSLIGSSSDQLVQTLPSLLDRQREALLAQLVGILKQESASVSDLTTNLRSTLEAGTQTANAVHGTLDVVERITGQFAGKPETPAAEKGPPFDIRNYTEMLREATTASRELDALAQRTDSLLPVLRVASQDTANRVNGILNHLFWLAVLLILVATAAVLLAALAYRRLVGHGRRSTS